MNKYNPDEVKPLYEEDYEFTHWFMEEYGENPVVVAVDKPKRLQCMYKAWVAGKNYQFIEEERRREKKDGG